MGKYIASPWGDISGKIGDAVGGSWKGIRWTRKRVIPENPGSIERHLACINDPTLCHLFSYKQMNVRRPILGMLGFVASHRLLDFILPIWQKLCDRRKLKLTGSNLFIKVNARRLYYSLPEGNELYSGSNLPDYTKMLVSIGRLEPVAGISSVAYDDATGTVDITWNPGHYTNGADDDTLFVAVYKKPEVGDLYYQPYGYLYLPTVTATRVDGTTSFSLEPGLTDTDLTIYLFFYNANIGYSPSKAKECGA